MRLEQFNYHLPQDRIAQYPLKDRAQSKLLVYRQGMIHHHTFEEIAACLPASSHLVFNDTKVIPARFRLTKQTGAIIEVFLLHPIAPSAVISEAMVCKGECQWQCMVGNKKRWKEETLEQTVSIGTDKLTIQLTWEDRDNNIIRFDWDNREYTFGQVVEAAGNIPLPPYLNREPVKEDKDRYQTVYSHAEGAVAAPTAGLHFTDQVLDDLKEHNITSDYLTLHVAAGTFLPVTTDKIQDHHMHEEQMVVTLDTLMSIVNQEFIVPVGTTSMRTLESLYWYGVELLHHGSIEFRINQETPYKYSSAELPDRKQALEAIIDKLKSDGEDQLVGETSIFIYPGYQLSMCNALITNFHQPESTLIMLVAALVGDQWQEIYQEALAKDYRFLSYGDSSLIIP